MGQKVLRKKKIRELLPRNPSVGKRAVRKSACAGGEEEMKTGREKITGGRLLVKTSEIQHGDPREKVVKGYAGDTGANGNRTRESDRWRSRVMVLQGRRWWQQEGDFIRERGQVMAGR